MKLYRYESHGLRYKHLNCIIMILHVYITYPKMIYIDSKAVIFGTNHMSINVAF